MEWNNLYIPKLQRLHRWSLGMGKWFHPTHFWTCDYLSMLGLKLNHVSKKGYWWDVCALPRSSDAHTHTHINQIKFARDNVLHVHWLFKCMNLIYECSVRNVFTGIHRYIHNVWSDTHARMPTNTLECMAQYAGTSLTDETFWKC